MSPLDGDAKPMPKSIQTANRTKRHRRPKATPAKWAGIVAEKQGPCLTCAAAPPNDMHHVIPRDRGGPDIAENIVPLCRHCHQLVELRERHTCYLLVKALQHEAAAPGPRGGVKDTYSWATDEYGENIWETVYHVYTRPVGEAA